MDQLFKKSDQIEVVTMRTIGTSAVITKFPRNFKTNINKLIEANYESLSRSGATAKRSPTKFFASKTIFAT